MVLEELAATNMLGKTNKEERASEAIRWLDRWADEAATAGSSSRWACERKFCF